MRKLIASFILAAFSANTCVPYAHARQVLDLPDPGMRVELSAAFASPLLKGVKIYPQDPFRLDFILDRGDSAASRDDASRLIKYFLASLTVPEEDLWVNLSPYEKDRIVPEAFGQTEMGRDLLAQDYILKQVTASLLYPDGPVGAEFWTKVYAQAQARFGTTDIPVDTFNKVWIVPEKATVFENKDAAFVVESKLKVMLESDYLAMSYNALPTGGHVAPQGNVSPSPLPSELASNVNSAQSLSQEVLRQVIIPVLEKEVNEGRHFASLRQVYHSLILATWFKDKIRRTLLGQAYVDQNKVTGVDIQDKAEKEKIWAQYVEAFRTGVFDLVKEEHDMVSDEVIPRKYFSGGAGLQIKARGVYGLTDEPSRLPSDFSMDNADVIAFEAEPLPPAQGLAGTRVLYDAMGENDVIGFSKFKYGAGEMTRRFGHDLAVKIRREFGEEILRDPDNWAIVSVGGSRFLGEHVAGELGLYFAYVNFHVPNLFNVSNYAAAADVGSRLNIINSRQFVLKNAGGLKAKKVILVDDLLNRGITLGKTRDFLEQKHRLDVAGTYVLFSIADREDPSLESRMNTAFVDAEGMESLIRMVNGEEVFVTRHLLKRIFYEQDRVRNFLALDPEKKSRVLCAAFGHVLASVSALMRVKADLVCRKVRGRPLELAFKAVIKGQRTLTGIYERFLLSHLGSLSRDMEDAVMTEGAGAVARIPVVMAGHEESLPFDKGRKFGAVLLDYDGVLKSKWERSPSREIMDLLVSLISRGYQVGIASGRTLKDLQKVIDGLRRRLPSPAMAESLYVFEQNGAHGYRVSDGKVLVPYKVMDQDDKAIILREIAAMTGVPSTWVGRRIYSSGAKVSVTVVSGRERQRFARELQQKIEGWGCKGRYRVFDTGEGVDIVPFDVHKGIAAEALAETLGLAQADILKVGDMYGPLGNDHPMLQKPGGVGVDSPAATAWLLKKVLDPAEAPARVNRNWFWGPKDMDGVDTHGLLQKLYTKDPDVPLRILDLGSDGQFLQELVTERWKGQVEGYALDIEKLRRLDLDIKDEIDGTEVFGLTDVEAGDPADIVAKYAGALKFNMIFMNAPDPDGNNIRDYVNEAAAFASGNTLVMLRLTRMDQRHLGAFAAAFGKRGFEYLGALNRPPEDYPMTDFINGDENDRMVYFFSDQDAAESFEDAQVLRASQLFFDPENTARVGGLLDLARGRLEGLFGDSIARRPWALIDNVRVVVSPNTPAFAQTLVEGPFGPSPVIVINALPVREMNGAQLLYLVGHELAHLVFDDVHARAQALLRSTGDLERNRALLAEIERRCDRLGLALAMDVFGPEAAGEIAQVPMLRQKYRGEIARLQKKYDLDHPVIFDPHMNDDERAGWLEDMISRYAKTFADGVDAQELADILADFPDRAMRPFTDEERRKIRDTLSYLQDVARAVQVEIDGPEWAGLFSSLRQWSAENGDKTDVELAREPGKIDAILATGEAMILKFKRIVDVVAGFKAGAEGLVTFNKSGEMAVNHAVTGEDLLYDLQDKIRKLDHVLGMSIDWIDMLRQQVPADVPAIAFRVRMIEDHVEEVLQQSYRDMLSDILHPEGIKDSYLQMKEDFSRESKGLPERIYTRFLLPARDVIVPDRGSVDLAALNVPEGVGVIKGGRPGLTISEQERAPIALVDEDGRPTGEAADNNDAHRRGLWHMVAHIYLIDPQGRLLLQVRSMDKKTSPGKLQVSISGHVDKDESPYEAARREADEEAGIAIDPARLVPVSGDNGVKRSAKAGEGMNNEYATVYLYRMNAAEMDGLRDKYNRYEIEEYWSMDFDKVEDLMALPEDPFAGSVRYLHDEYRDLYRAIRSEAQRGSRPVVPFDQMDNDRLTEDTVVLALSQDEIRGLEAQYPQYDWQNAAEVIWPELVRNSDQKIEEQKNYFGNQVYVRRDLLFIVRDLLSGNLSDEAFVERMRQVHIDLITKTGVYPIRRTKGLGGESFALLIAGYVAGPGDLGHRRLVQLKGMMAALLGPALREKTMGGISTEIGRFYASLFQWPRLHIFPRGNHSWLMQVVNTMLRLYHFDAGIPHGHIDKKPPADRSIIVGQLVSAIQEANPGVDLDQQHDAVVSRKAAAAPGGIDLDAKKLPLEVRSGGEGVHFDLDAAAVRRFQDAVGLTPVIIDIHPMTTSLPKFLGLSDNIPAQEMLLR